MDESNYLVPTGDGKGTIAINLESILIAEQRLRDVAIVNHQTAPELLASFNEAWLRLNKSVSHLTYEKNKAENFHKTSIADAKLNCTDDHLKKLGHSKASADLREAFVQKDPTVQTAKERLDEITYVLDVLKGKMQAFYNAYGSVKRLVDNKGLPPAQYGDNHKQQPFQSLPEDDDLRPLPPGFGTSRR